MGTAVEARMKTLVIAGVIPRGWADADAGKGRKTWSSRWGWNLGLFGSLKESRRT